MKPTPELLAHVDVEPPRVDSRSFRQGWRIRTRLDQLLSSGRLTAAQWQAAAEYRSAWERVMAQMHRLPNTMRPSGTRGINAIGSTNALTAVLGTVTKIRETEARIGQTAALLCFWCAVEDHSWASTGRSLNRSPHTVLDWTVTALQGLELAWNANSHLTRNRRLCA